MGRSILDEITNNGSFWDKLKVVLFTNKGTAGEPWPTKEEFFADPEVQEALKRHFERQNPPNSTNEETKK